MSPVGRWKTREGKGKNDFLGTLEHGQLREPAVAKKGVGCGAPVGPGTVVVEVMSKERVPKGA